MPADAVRIVIAEDNSLVLRALRDALGQVGFEVIGEATDGVEAVALVAEGPLPDVFVMNGRMPNMDGWEATRRIKRLHPHLPVLIHTTYRRHEVAAVSREAGADGLLGGIVTLESFIEAISALAAGGTYGLDPHLA